MIDFGGANDHGNRISFGDSSVIGYMDGMVAVALWFRFRLKSGAGTWGYVMGKRSSTATEGWAVYFDLAGTGRQLIFGYGNGSAWRQHVCATVLTVGNWYTAFFWWYGYRYGAWYLNGSLANTTDSGSGFERIQQASATPFMIGNAGGWTNRGAAVEIDNVIVWPYHLFMGVYLFGTSGGHQLDESLRAGISTGVHDIRNCYQPMDAYPVHDGLAPVGMSPRFWWPGEYTPGRNVILHDLGGGEAGTATGGPAICEDHCDTAPFVALDAPSHGVMAAGAGTTQSKTGKMSTALYTEVTGRNRTHFAVEVDMPDGTIKGFAKASLPTDSQEYELLATKLSSIRREIRDSEYRLQPVGMSVVIADDGRTLSRLFSGRFDGRMEGRPARVKLVSPHVAESQWMTVFEGIVLGWQPRGNLPEITLSFGPNDKALREANRLGRFTRGMFPDAPDDVIGEPLRVIYGNFDSRCGGGGVECPAVGFTEWGYTQYFVSTGQTEVIAAYDDGVMASGLTSNDDYLRGGRQVSLLSMYPEPSGTVTADVSGVPSFIAHTYGGFGLILPIYGRRQLPMTNPIEQLLHFLVNYCYGSYVKGQYLSPSDAPIDVESFVAAAGWYRLLGTRGRTIVYGDETGYQFINRWVGAWKVPVFWNANGKLALKVDDFFVRLADQDLLVDHEDGVGNLLTINKDQDLKTGIRIKHGYDFDELTSLQETYAEDGSDEIVDEVTQEWEEKGWYL